ncbi:MAG: heat-inducible transcriptional repressor HrcA [Actinomycetota bacterium]|jgi:heat-inducible transcriptional repressor|nr:heat-inducible transcriptional repressor HrcA [Actinomycetota bacterium]
MLDERKAAILRAVVECHIRTAQPVSSAHVAEMSGLGVSPATVRNEMVVLEQEGYLLQPHSSAGRVPTDKGYRFFVDSLTGPSPLEPRQAELVRLFFARTHGEIERLLAETSGLLSSLTDYAAVVVAPNAPEPGRVRSLHLVKLAPHLVLAVAVLGSGAVERRAIETPAEVSDDEVDRASGAVATWFAGGPLDKVGSPAPTGEPTVDALASAAVEALRHPESPEGGHVFVGGAARMAAAFEAVGTIRTVLGILEEQYVLVSLLRDVIDRGLTVAIGAEHGLQPLADCSVVVAPYEVDGERAGTVGVLGPTRMHYDQALAAVAVVSTKLSQALSESGFAPASSPGGDL